MPLKLKQSLLLGAMYFVIATPAWANTPPVQENPIVIDSSSKPTTAAAISQPATNGLSLQQAIKMALKQSPVMQGADAAVKAAVGEREQASAWTNPELSAEFENIGGSGPYRGFDSAENTFGVSQLIEIGGKRSARTAMAEHGKTMSVFGKAATEQDLIRDVKIAYMNAAAAQEQVRLVEDQAKLAKDILGNVNTRVDAAAEPVIQRNKANVALASAEIALERARRSQNIAQKNLALLWGGMDAPQVDTDDFYKTDAPLLIDNPDALLSSSADYQRDTAALDRAESAFELEQANAVPDPTITAGFRDFQDSDNQAFIVGVSIPLPVLNLNSGNIERARQEAVQANAGRRKSLLDRKARFNEHQEQLQASYAQVAQFKDNILPQSEEALKQAQRGYGLGRFAFLEVLDAQRTLAESRLTYISALLDYHTRKAEIERLVAQPEVTK